MIQRVSRHTHNARDAFPARASTCVVACTLLLVTIRRVSMFVSQLLEYTWLSPSEVGYIYYMALVQKNFDPITMETLVNSITRRLIFK